MKLCTKCGGPNLRWPQRYCHTCHAVYQREWRAGQRQRRLILENALTRMKVAVDEATRDILSVL